MTTLLNEVPGARERPGGCPIRIESAPGVVTISLPPRGVSPIVFLIAAILLGNLLVALYTGLMLLGANKSVLLMAQISPSGLPVSLRHSVLPLLGGLLFAEALGVFTLGAILRPLSVRETITLDRNGVAVRHSEWGRVRERRLRREDVRGFHLRRIPPGLDAGVLTVQGRGEEVEVGEFLREADREWLLSVGNALLRTGGV